MALNNRVINFVLNIGSNHDPRPALELSRKLLEAKKNKLFKKVDAPQWFTFLSEEARDLLLPAVFIMKSASAAH